MATKRPVTVVSDRARAHLCCNAQTQGDVPMNTILKLLDRASLGLINALVIAGMPLAAFGLLTNAL